MKFSAIILSMLLSNWAFANSPIMIEEVNQITCIGQTYEGDTYNIGVYYTMDPTWLENETPYTITTGKRAFVSLQVERQGQVVYEEALYTNDLMLTQTEDSRHYQLKKIETEKVIENGSVVFNDITTDFLNITMIAEQPSSFDFELKTAYGTFKNGQCRAQ